MEQLGRISMKASTRSTVIGALALGLLLLCLNSLVMVINTKFASQTGSTDKQFSVGTETTSLILINVLTLSSPHVIACSNRIFG